MKLLWMGILGGLLLGCQPKTRESEAAPYSGFFSIPERGIYAGAYVDFGEAEDHVTLEAIEKFDELVGRSQAIIGSSSYWGEQSFPSKNMRLITSYGAIPLLYWSPWDRPYLQNRGPDRFDLNSILAGKWDDYIDRWAEGAREFGKPILVAWGLEMNGIWFPWSGQFYGAGKKIPNTNPIQYQGPELYKKAYRHVVDRVRARRASNVKWVFHSMNFPYPYEPWNMMDQYYPGSDYVDWLGMSVYGKQFADGDWANFEDLFDLPYKHLCALDPTKPVMLAEWGVGEFPKVASRGTWIREGFETMKKPKYSRLKAIVFWHERWENSDGSFSNLRVNSTTDALEAYQQGIRNPYYLDRPIQEKTASEAGMIQR